MAEEGRVVIHIEVSTDESQQLKEMQARLADMEKTLYRIRSSRTNRKLMGDEGGAPIRTDTDTGPIFRGVEESEEVSTISRPGKGKQAYSRQDIFKNLKDKVDDVEEQQNKLAGTIENALPGLLSGSIISATSGILGWIKPLTPFISEALVAGGFIKQIYDNLFAPGGIFDRRWREEVRNLVVNTLSRNTLSQIRQGFRVVRMSSWIGKKAGIRGQTGSSLSGVNRGNFIYNSSLESMNKGFAP